MIVLGIETATPLVGCALGDDGGPLASFSLTGGRRHAETLAPAIAFIAGQAGVALSEVDVVAVDVGPGLFTGLRVGVATAKAMAQALGVQVVPVLSLDLLAIGMGEHPDRLIAAVIDARRHEVFSALYRPTPGGVERLREPEVGPPDALGSELATRGGPWLCVGDGARRYAGALAVPGRVDVLRHGSPAPSAAVLVEVAHARALAKEGVDPAWVDPVYLRAADAVANFRTAASEREA